MSPRPQDDDEAIEILRRMMGSVSDGMGGLGELASTVSSIAEVVNYLTSLAALQSGLVLSLTHLAIHENPALGELLLPTYEKLEAQVEEIQRFFVNKVVEDMEWQFPG